MTKYNLTAQTPVVAPWIAEPYRLWSLHDMLDFYAPLYGIACRDFGSASQLMYVFVQDGRGGDSIAGIRSDVERVTTNLAEAVSKLPLPLSLKGSMSRLIERIRTDNSLTIKAAYDALIELDTGIIEEITQAWFLAIPSTDSELYRQRNGAPFGADVDKRFPDADYDIRAAARCLALSQWTAAVFHTMRAVEHGLRALANDIGVDTPQPIEYSEMGKVVGAIEKKIAALRSTHGHDAARLEFYANALVDISGFKDGYRNPVMHSRTQYDEVRSKHIFLNAGAFMRHLATGIVALTHAAYLPKGGR